MAAKKEKIATDSQIFIFLIRKSVAKKIWK